MAGEADLELEARARARARARAELELAQIEEAPSVKEEPSLLDRAASGAAKIPGAIYQGVKGAINTAGEIIGGYNPVESLPQNLYRGATNLYDAARENPAATIRAAAMAPAALASPVLAPVFATGLNYLGGKTAQVLGYEDPSSLGDDIEEAVTMAGVSAAPSVAIKGANQIIKKAPALTEAGQLYRSRQKQGILTALQDAPKGTTNAERALAQSTIEIEPQFQQRNLFQRLDPSNPLEAMKTYRTRLADLVKNGSENKKTLLKNIVLKEQEFNTKLSSTGEYVPPSSRLALKRSDIDFSNLDRMAEAATPEQLAGIEAAKRELLNEFYEPTYKLNEASQYVPTDTPDLTKPIAKSIAEHDLTLKRIDNRIKELGGYDDAYMAANKINPSNINAEINALKAARAALAKGIKKYISENFGKNLAASLAKANDDISVGIRYGELAERFDAQGLESFTPGSGRSMNTAMSRIPSRMEDVGRALTGRSKRAEQFRQGALRSENMIRDSQRIINWRNGAPPPLLSRDWDLVKTNPASLSVLSTILATTGIDPATVQRMPDSDQKKLFTKIVESYPEVFEIPEGGYSSYANGKLNSPIDRSAHLEAALDSKFDFAKEASIVAPLLERGEYVPLESQPSFTLPQAPSIDISDIARSFESMPGSTFSYQNKPSETANMIEQMNKSKSQIDFNSSGL